MEIIDKQRTQQLKKAMAAKEAAQGSWEVPGRSFYLWLAYDIVHYIFVQMTSNILNILIHVFKQIPNRKKKKRDQLSQLILNV